MSVFVHPELARLAIREGLELSFVVWSILRNEVVANKHSGHFTKKDAIAIAANHGLRFTVRHWSRIWASGNPIFWGSDNNRIFLRSFRRVCWRFAEFRQDKDLSALPQAFLIRIQLSGGIEDLRAQLYHAWFFAVGRKDHITRYTAWFIRPDTISAAQHGSAARLSFACEKQLCTH